MGKIFLVRHGQDTDNSAGILNGRRDTELTDLGRQQARQAGEKLRDCNTDVIYTSPLKRTYETAQIIADVLGIKEILKEDGLIEREFGVMTGKLVVDIPKYADQILVTDRVNYFLDGEGVENFPMLLERGRKVLKEIQQKHPDQNVLLVTHGDIGKMIRAAYYDWDWERGLKTPYFDNTEVLELS